MEIQALGPTQRIQWTGSAGRSGLQATTHDSAPDVPVQRAPAAGLPVDHCRCSAESLERRLSNSFPRRTAKSLRTGITINFKYADIDAPPQGLRMIGDTVSPRGTSKNSDGDRRKETHRLPDKAIKIAQS